jgi:hypothetical protein
LVVAAQSRAAEFTPRIAGEQLAGAYRLASARADHTEP